MRQSSKLVYFFFTLLSLAHFYGAEVSAEPWLSNRFAKNCAACHAPGRVNKPAIDRRCSLSCEGCHVNPNGGGLRNAYGKWGQKKWLRSMTWKNWAAGEKAPATRDKQYYAHRYPKEVRPKLSKERFVKLNKKFKKSRPVPLASAKTLDVDEELYSKEMDPGSSYESKDERQFLSLIPKDDPYRQEKELGVIAGADARFFYLDSQNEPAGGVMTTSSGLAMMGFDLGVAFKPFTSNFTLVFEHRYFNVPSSSGAELEWDLEWDKIFVTRGITRSAYAKLNDLPYNTYAMAGIYRPMFGSYNPNHFALRERLLFRTAGGPQSAVYEGISVGGAPNVPFFNASYLVKGSQGIGDGSEGFILNAGARAIKGGMSGLLSYWSTQKEAGNNVLNKQMISASGGFNLFNRLIGTGELVLLEEDTVSGSNIVRNKGYVGDVDFKYRIWRELYPQFRYSWSNIARDLSQGNSSEISFGAKFFALAGLEFEFLYTLGAEKRETPSLLKTDYSYLTFQTHAFW